MNGSEQAIETAQAIVDSVCDIRPALKGKIVSGVKSEPLTAIATFTDGSEISLHRASSPDRS